MSVQNPVSSTEPGGWGTVPTDAWRNWKPERPKAPGCKHIIPKHPTYILLEDDGPIKRPKLGNGTLFYLLPMDIINVVDDWIIGLEHNKTFNIIVAHIKMVKSVCSARDLG